MQDRWEYKTIWGHGFGGKSLRDAEGMDYGPFSLENADEFLNGLGRQGWEVCALLWATAPHIVLKRRISAA